MSWLTRAITEAIAVDLKRSRYFKEVGSIAEEILTSQVELDENEIWAAITHQVNLGGNGNFLELVGVKSSSIRKVSPRIKNVRLFNPTTLRERKSSDAAADFLYVDLFAGIGGFHLALAAQGGRCAFASEIDDQSRLTYAMNFGIVPFGDIRLYTRGENGKPNSSLGGLFSELGVIAAGFPCQPFSLAGVSSRNFHGLEHGLNCDDQGTLFEDIVIFAKALRPKALLLENVKNLASHDGGNTLRVILGEIASAGYEVFPRWDGKRSGWAILDSASVVAQRRKRVYLVCIRKDLLRKGEDFVFPKFISNRSGFDLASILKKDKTPTKKKFDEFGISKKLWLSHQKRDKRHALMGRGFRTGLMTDLSKPAPTLVARYYKDGKDCLIPHPSRKDLPPRMLTPRECAYLQTFPSNFWIPKSKSAAYRQFGNAITVEIARRVASSLINYLYRSN